MFWKSFYEDDIQLVHLDVLSLDHRKPPRACLAAARLVSGSLGDVLLEGLYPAWNTSGPIGHAPYQPYG